MIIAQRGKYSLRTKTYINPHVYKTCDIEICKEDADGVLTIAMYKHNELYSIDNRLLDSINNNEDLSNLKKIVQTGFLIVKGDDVESKYRTMDVISTSSINSRGEITKTKTRRYPNEGSNIPIYEVYNSNKTFSKYFWNAEDAEDYKEKNIECLETRIIKVE